MNKYCVITIDVEPDCTPTWKYSSPLTFQGVTKGIQQILQPLFNKYDACPTYLINNVVLENQRCTDTFRQLKGRFELGTHLHAEFIEPEKQFQEYAGKKGESNQCSLKPEIEFEKMKNITALFEQNFDQKPTAFRAGRFSAGQNTITSLQKLGYKVDTSVTPHVRWRDATRERPVDYRKAYEQPYFIKEGDYMQSDNKGVILEVPVSIVNIWTLFKRKPLWLRPYVSSYKDFMTVIGKMTRKHRHNKNVVFNMMFHNVEVIPKLSPYPQTEEESKCYIDSLERFLAYCTNNNIKTVGLSELYDLFKEKA